MILGHSFLSVTIKLIHVREQTQRKQTSKPKAQSEFSTNVGVKSLRYLSKHYLMCVSSSLSNVLNRTIRLKYGWIKSKSWG